ncbi:MAG TPA: hypothetical protein VGA04_19795 [Streptosporangiaceae bacterium]
MAEGVGVTAEEGDVVGTPVGCGVPAGDTELAGVVCEVGLGVARTVGPGVTAGADVAGTGPVEVEGCTVGVTPTVAGDGGLTST